MHGSHAPLVIATSPPSLTSQTVGMAFEPSPPDSPVNNVNYNAQGNGPEGINSSTLINGKKSREGSPRPLPVVNLNLTAEELRSIKLRNQNMRQMIYKEVKRPGKNHEKLFAMLRTLHGPSEIRRDYIGEVILEAKRFKRRLLAEMLEQKMDELLSPLKDSNAL